MDTTYVTPPRIKNCVIPAVKEPHPSRLATSFCRTEVPYRFLFAHTRLHQRILVVHDHNGHNKADGIVIINVKLALFVFSLKPTKDICLTPPSGTTGNPIPNFASELPVTAKLRTEETHTTTCSIIFFYLLLLLLNIITTTYYYY